jgi:stage II sporulation protein R
MGKGYSARRYGFIAFAIIVLIFCWEGNKTNAAVISPSIPQEAIRLRILANSDAVQDQAVKRQVRDAIMEQMNSWVTEPKGIEEARQVVQMHIPGLNLLIGEKLQALGYNYNYKVELGIVPFPAKMYGDEAYPAGNYEALRVTLGKGEGQNWWCVLFPPLCFVNAVAAENAAKQQTEEEPIGSSGDAVQKENLTSAAHPEIHFYVWDKSQEWIAKLKGLL